MKLLHQGAHCYSPVIKLSGNQKLSFLLCERVSNGAQVSDRSQNSALFRGRLVLLQLNIARSKQGGFWRDQIEQAAYEAARRRKGEA